MIDTIELLARLQARRATPFTARAAAVAGRLLAQAPAFGLERPDDVVEVFDLWLSLAEHAPDSSYVQGMLRVVLSIKRWPLAARIAFLRRHLTGRELTSGADADALVLFDMSEEAAT
jgi:hypothetical protein